MSLNQDIVIYTFCDCRQLNSHSHYESTSSIENVDNNSYARKYCKNFEMNKKRCLVTLPGYLIIIKAGQFYYIWASLQLKI